VCRVCEEVDEEGVVIALLKRGFEVYPGYFFGLDLPGRSHFVISAVAPQEALLQGISALEESVVATTAKKAGAKQREKRY
jgi:DNA-binding transcriptional MocR family regulator